MAELTLRECIEALRSFEGRWIKPFVILPKLLDSAVVIMEQQLPAAKKELESLTRSIGELQAELPALEREVATARERTAAVVKDAREADDAAQAAVAHSESQARDRDMALTKDYEDKRAVLEGEYNDVVATLGAEIRGLEETRDRLAQEVAAHRDKFRTF